MQFNVSLMIDVSLCLKELLNSVSLGVPCYSRKHDFNIQCLFLSDNGVREIVEPVNIRNHRWRYDHGSDHQPHVDRRNESTLHVSVFSFLLDCSFLGGYKDFFATSIWLGFYRFIIRMLSTKAEC